MASFLTSEVSISSNGEQGEFVIREFINTKKPSCLLCEKKICEVYLCFLCHCWGCHTDDYVCKKCALTTGLFTHLCKCFRQTTRHLWYDLKIIFAKIEGNQTIIHFCLIMSLQQHHNSISFKFLDNKKKCSICNLQSPIYYDNIYYVVECDCPASCGAVAYTCDECVETHKLVKNCTENKICWLCKTVKCEFF